MATVSLTKHRVNGPLLLRRGGQTYALTAQEKTQMPAGIAVGLLGDTGLKINFTASDEAELLGLNDYLLNILRKEFNVSGSAIDVCAVLFPKKTIIPKIKKIIPKVVVPQEEPKVEVKKVVEEKPTKKTTAKKPPATKKKAGGK